MKRRVIALGSSVPQAVEPEQDGMHMQVGEQGKTGEARRPRRAGPDRQRRWQTGGQAASAA